MAQPSQLPATEPRLRVSPNFALSFAFDGRPFLAQEVEPYAHYWLTPDERLLLSLFPGRGGLTADAVVDAHLRVTGRPGAPRTRGRLLKLIREMHAAGVLIGPDDDVSRYDAAMAADYLRHRPIPPSVVGAVVERSGIGPSSRVLDLAGGPGNLALRLAETGAGVTLMELSRGFIDAAGREARRLGLPLERLHESCNRLPAHEGRYDVVTVSQALHWLDDVAVCRGVCRVLRPGGSFVVVHAALTLPPQHPLSFVLGDRTPLGDKAPAPFPDQAHALARRLGLLFEALDAPDVQRIDPAPSAVGARERIAFAGTSFLRDERPIDLGFARAFLSARHVAATGMSPEAFWAKAAALCEAADPARLVGRQDWAVIQFRAGGPDAADRSLDAPARLRRVG